MRRSFIVITAVLCFCAAANIAAQGRPDFSGKWMLEQMAPASADRQFPPELMVKQDANTLTITRQGTSVAFKLDGSENKNPAPKGEAVSKATWDGNKLVIVETFPGGGEQKRVMSMEGGNLVIEITEPGRSSAFKLVFKKG